MDQTIEAVKETSEVVPGVGRSYNATLNMRNAAYGHRVAMTEAQFHSMEGDLRRELNSLALRLWANGNHGWQPALAASAEYKEAYMEVSLGGYSIKNNGEVKRELPKIIENACKKHGIEYVGPAGDELLDVSQLLFSECSNGVIHHE
jgi:hypothetical protein